MMQHLFNFRINFAILLSILILTTGGCKWFDSEGHFNPSENHELASLIVSEGSLSPAFGVDVRDYSVGVENSVESIQVTATLGDNLANLTINGAAATSGVISDPISLSVGANSILIVATAENGESRTITITVTRAEPAVASNDATLAAR